MPSIHHTVHHNSIKVLVLGDSFMKWLYKYILDQDYSTNLDLGFVEIKWHGIGGRTISKIQLHDLKEVTKFKPGIVVIHVGSNDLCDAQADPASLADMLLKLAEDLHHKYDVPFVILNQVIYRRDLPHPKYNLMVDQFNSWLKVVTAQEEYSHYLKYWFHKGLCLNPQKHLFDGTHLDKEGNLKLHRSLRGAVLHALAALG